MEETSDWICVTVHDSNIRVVIVEDHVYTANGLVDTLSKFPGIEVVGVTGQAEEGLKFAARLKPQIVLLDLHLKGGPPANELLEAYATGQPWKVIVFSAEERGAFIEAALEHGAAAFLSKSEQPERLVDCIKSVANDGTKGPLISRDLVHESARLSPALEELVKMLGKGLKYNEIAALKNASPESVRKQCDRLQMKLKLSSREQLIAWAVEHGYTALD